MNKVRNLVTRSKTIRRGPFTFLSVCIATGKNDPKMIQAKEMFIVRGEHGFYYATPRAVATVDKKISEYYYLHNTWSYPI